jgi:gas vesicle protein
MNEQADSTTEQASSTVGYLIAGIAIGSLIGVLFAPKSGEGTRKHLWKKVSEGSKRAHRKARELRERTEDFVERAKEAVNETREQIAANLDEVDLAHPPHKSKAKGA